MSKSSGMPKLVPARSPPSRARAGASSTPPPPSGRWSRSPRSCSPSTATPPPRWTRSWPAPGSPRARSTTTSAASRRCSRRSSSGSRPTPSQDDPARRSRATGTRGRRRTAGLRAFLEVVQEPRYRRIVIQEGPAVLGYERFREQEERSTFAIVLDIVRSVLGAGAWELDEDDAADLRPDLLRRDVVGRRVGRRPPRTRARPPTGSRPRSGSSSPASSSLADARRRSCPTPWSRTTTRERRSLLREGDVAAVAAGPARSRCGRRARSASPALVDSLSGASRPLLRPGAAHQPAVVEEQRLALAVELASRAPGCRPGRGSRRRRP